MKKNIKTSNNELDTTDKPVDQVSDEMGKIKDSEPNYDKTEEEILKELESQNIIVRDLSKDKSILEDLRALKPVKSTDKIYTEEDMKEKILNTTFAVDVMKKFNFFVNEQAKSFIEQTKKYEDIEEDSVNIFMKISPSTDRERSIFNEKLLSYGEKKRPIYISVGEFDLFFEYFDKDGYPIFSYNRKNLVFFFSNDISKLKTYIESNKCTFGQSSYRKDRFGFDNLLVEIIEKKKKQKIEEKTSKVEEPKKEDVKEEVKEEPKLQEETKHNKKVCKVKFINSNQLFILAENPGDIFKEFDNEVLSVKIVGEGISI
jgi:hypothetical protein